MKWTTLLALILFSIIILGQNDSSSLHVSIMEYSYSKAEGNDSIVDGYIYHLEEGVNLVIDTACSFKMIGTAEKRFKLKFLFYGGNGMYMTFTGLWTYYCEGKIVGYESFDKKGNTIGKVQLYDNGQVKTAKYRTSRKQHFEYSESFFKNGNTIRVPEDLEKWISDTREKNCAPHRY